MSKRDSLDVTIGDHLQVVIASVREQAERDRLAAREYEDLWRRTHEATHENDKQSLKDRLEKLNELKAMAEDSARLFATGAELRSEVKRIDGDIRGLREWRAEMNGKASVTSVYLAYLISLVSLVLAAVRLWKG